MVISIKVNGSEENDKGTVSARQKMGNGLSVYSVRMR